MLKDKKIDYYKVLIWLVSLVLILIPIFLYQYRFGISLSKNREIWDQFGSYISGVYAPFFSFLTLLLLFRQNKSQVKMDSYQRENNDALRLRDDADFYLNSLDKNLTSNANIDSSIISTLLRYFSNLSFQELENSDLSIHGDLIHSQNQKILANWTGFNIALKSLKTYENTSFEHHYISTKLKPLSIFGYSYCTALDNYCYIQSKRQVICNEYSEIIPETS